jgi:hypothetical protein
MIRAFEKKAGERTFLETHRVVREVMLPKEVGIAPTKRLLLKFLLTECQHFKNSDHKRCAELRHQLLARLTEKHTYSD